MFRNARASEADPVGCDPRPESGNGVREWGQGTISELGCWRSASRIHPRTFGEISPGIERKRFLTWTQTWSLLRSPDRLTIHDGHYEVATVRDPNHRAAPQMATWNLPRNPSSADFHSQRFQNLRKGAYPFTVSLDRAARPIAPSEIIGHRQTAFLAAIGP